MIKRQVEKFMNLRITGYPLQSETLLVMKVRVLQTLIHGQTLGQLYIYMVNTMRGTMLGIMRILDLLVSGNQEDGLQEVTSETILLQQSRFQMKNGKYCIRV